MKKIFLILLILFVGIVSGEQLFQLKELVNPDEITIIKDSLYVLDGVKVQVFSLQDGRLVNQFGEEGRGPGELVQNPDIPVVMRKSGDTIVLNSINKIVFYSSSGKMLKEKTFPFIVLQIIPVGDDFIINKFGRHESGVGQLSVVLTDSEFNIKQTYYSCNLLNDRKKGKIAYPLLGLLIRFFNQKVFIVDQQRNFEIDVFDLTGKKLTTIKKDYVQVPITRKLINEKKEWLKIQPAYREAPHLMERMIYFLSHLASIRNFFANKDGIIVETNKKRDNLTEFFVFDHQGRLIKRTFLPHHTEDKFYMVIQACFRVCNGNYYYLEENTGEDSWELHRKKILD